MGLAFPNIDWVEVTGNIQRLIIDGENIPLLRLDHFSNEATLKFPFGFSDNKCKSINKIEPKKPMKIASNI